jgi:hypothetical protein
LTKTLDKFLKRLTDIEEEFTFMKEDLKRVQSGDPREARGFARLNTDFSLRKLKKNKKRTRIPLALFVSPLPVSPKR